jgi:hypothetical protein
MAFTGAPKKSLKLKSSALPPALFVVRPVVLTISTTLSGPTAT